MANNALETGVTWLLLIAGAILLFVVISGLVGQITGLESLKGGQTLTVFSLITAVALTLILAAKWGAPGSRVNLFGMILLLGTVGAVIYFMPKLIPSFFVAEGNPTGLLTPFTMSTTTAGVLAIIVFGLLYFKSKGKI
jgi:hypothetical protein